MPLKLLIFAPCQKVIVGQDNTTSIISVIEAMKVNVTDPIPEDAGLGMVWNIVTLWHRTDPIEGNQQCQQRVEVVTANGKKTVDVVQDFTVSNEFSNFRNVLEVHGFPIGHEGLMSLKLSLKESIDAEWGVVAEYPIPVTHSLVEKPVNADAQ